MQKATSNVQFIQNIIDNTRSHCESYAVYKLCTFIEG